MNDPVYIVTVVITCMVMMSLVIWMLLPKTINRVIPILCANAVFLVMIANPVIRALEEGFR